MDIHNTAEDLVIAEVNALCDSLEAEQKEDKVCTCNQCRQDAACFVLNRTKPYYVVSHRGLSRANSESDTQRRADLTALAYEGIRRVNHNKRPYADHSITTKDAVNDNPAFYIPTIMGRVFNGLNFSPMTGIKIELLHNGKLAEMKDANWQNPYSLIPNTGGVFTFWPKPVAAEKADNQMVFEFTVKITADGFAELNHTLSMSVTSEVGSPSFSLVRTHKLPNLYLFPPGEEKDQLLINE